ncbi:hypothetical protein Ddc_03006 [Ditylenchus destructor]|nr:hypothetical protein Ddc_03006 [Ditylenchus destructor]
MRELRLFEVFFLDRPMEAMDEAAFHTERLFRAKPVSFMSLGQHAVVGYMHKSIDACPPQSEYSSVSRVIYCENPRLERIASDIAHTVSLFYVTCINVFGCGYATPSKILGLAEQQLALRKVPYPQRLPGNLASG